MNFFDDNSDVEHDQFDGIVAHPTIMQARDTETDFGGLLAAPIKLHEDLAKGCGGQIWPAGELLTKYVLKMYMGTHGLRNKRILELGAGGGLTSLAVAAGCDLEGSELFVTDMDAMIDLIHKNIALNGLQKVPELKVELLDWKDPIPEVIATKPIDIVFAADCVYYEPAFPLLEKTIKALVSDNTVVYFCFKQRRRADMQFVKTLKKRFSMHEITELRQEPEYAAFSRENLHL
ncbi:putative methyltransferase-domain-containing protein [Tricharina praecox]|uniref:putative methyltransferase-domain-containing protein n=1 Tax=Tricharina praecox TaxID=43433 RepID=UPI002220E999|nr:putative methyltransferase-domain-containing protein [Tricharina praecox]KAI5857135.1 putative methyltransferase-domain-containing protein [Tricharina praecox]